MSTLNGEIGLQLAQDRMERLHADAAHERLVRGRAQEGKGPNTRTPAGAIAAVFTRSMRSLGVAH